MAEEIKYIKTREIELHLISLIGIRPYSKTPKTEPAPRLELESIAHSNAGIRVKIGAEEIIIPSKLLLKAVATLTDGANSSLATPH